jgi:hypothetical protein
MNSHLHTEIARQRHAEHLREAELHRRASQARPRELPSILSFSPVRAQFEVLGLLARRRRPQPGM